MGIIKAAPPDGIRVIACLSFASRAPFDELAALKDGVVGCKRVLHSVEVSGTFDMMFEAECEDLETYRAMLDAFTAKHGYLLKRYEANFVCRRFLRKEESKPQWLWVPCGSGSQRIDHALIDKVTAERDYVRIHSGSNSWLLHATMKKVCEELGSDSFLRISRSVIVRADFITRLIHDLHFWQVKLVDGSKHRVPRSRQSKVLSRIKTETSATRDQPGMLRGSTDNQPQTTKAAFRQKQGDDLKAPQSPQTPRRHSKTAP